MELFDTSERVRQRYGERFRHVLVDEYQDTNRPPYLLIRHLAGHHRRLCVVGDPDQSIYKWRGADVRNILDFEKDFPDACTVRLEQNYRSTQVILDAATAVIRQNHSRKDKRLWTDREGGRLLVLFRGGDEIEEADFITRVARDAVAKRAGTDHGGPVPHERTIGNRTSSPGFSVPTASSVDRPSSPRGRTAQSTCRTTTQASYIA